MARLEQVLLPLGGLVGTVSATTFPRLQAAVRRNRVMDDPDFDGAGRGLQAKGGAPDPAPRSSGDQGSYLACLPAQNVRPSHSESSLRGLPRAAQAAWSGYFFASVTGSPHPIGPARSQDPRAFKKISRARLNPARLANGRWPVPFRGAGLRGRRDRRYPGSVARGGIRIRV